MLANPGGDGVCRYVPQLVFLRKILTRTRYFLKMSPRNRPAGKLDLLVIQPSPFCNLDCDYCYLPNRQSKRRIEPRVLRRIFERVFESDVVADEFTVVWHAGEPLALPIEFYREALGIIAETNTGAVCVEHSYQTNGTLIDERWCEFIRKHSLRIGVSVDGPDFLHDLHRKTRGGRGTFDRVMGGIEHLQCAGSEFHVITVLTRDTLDYPDELFDFYSSNKIATVAFNVEEIEGPHQNSSLQASDAYAKFTRFMSRFYDLVEQNGHRISVREFNSAMSALLWRCKERLAKCQQINPFEIISVDVRGNFSTFSPELLGLTSLEYGDFVFGNVETEALESARECEKFQAVHRDIQRGVELCEQTCSYFNYCGGGAPVNKYFENGRFDSTETMFCRFAKKAVFDVVLSKIESALASKSARPLVS
jgi:uncharacterized protein